MLEILDKSTHSPVRVATRAVHVNLLEADGAHYVALVNDLRVPGRYYGHFGKTREQGVEQTAHVEVDASLGRYAFNLLTGKGVEMKVASQTANAFAVKLPPAGGCVIALLQFEPHALAAKVAERTDERVVVEATLADVSGGPLPGRIPCRIDIARPDGSTDDRSCYGALVNGKLRVEWPVPYNAPAGTYKMTITESASGKTGAAEWQVDKK